MSVVYTHQGGKIISNYEELGVVTVVYFDVPPGKKWKWLYGQVERDINSDFHLSIRDENGDVVYQSATEPAGVTNLTLPTDLTDANDVAFLTNQPQMGGDYQMRYNWGIAQTTPAVACVVLET